MAGGKRPLRPHAVAKCGRWRTRRKRACDTWTTDRVGATSVHRRTTIETINQATQRKCWRPRSSGEAQQGAGRARSDPADLQHDADLRRLSDAMVAAESLLGAPPTGARPREQSQPSVQARAMAYFCIPQTEKLRANGTRSRTRCSRSATDMNIEGVVQAAAAVRADRWTQQDSCARGRGREAI